MAPPNTAPTLAGIPSIAQFVRVGQAVELADITVADVDSSALTVTVEVLGGFGRVGGTLGGLTDADPILPGIQLKGTAAQINAALAAATFTAHAVGQGHLRITADDGIASVVSHYAFTVVAAANAAPTFAVPNGTGKLLVPVGSGADEAYSIALQADGKIVVAGHSYNGSDFDFSLIRLNADGSLDTSFNGTGKLLVDVGGDDEAYSVTLQPDGKIVVAGLSDNDFGLIRLNADGTLDTSFNGTGKLLVDVGGSNDRANSITLQPDGKIVVAGSRINGSDISLTRLNADGTLDMNFNGTGKQLVDVGIGEEGQSVTLQPDGKIVVAGYSYNGTGIDFLLIRLNADGSLDQSFGGNDDGKLLVDMGSIHDQARSLTLQPDGKIVVAGYSYNGSDYDFSLIRLNADGTLDQSFDGDGKLLVQVGNSADQAYSVTLQPDGKIVVAGASLNGSDNDFSLIRLNADGTLDRSFGGNDDGKLLVPLGSDNDQARSITLQPDGKIVVAGYSHNGSNSDFSLIRLNPDGTLDTSFNAPANPANTLGGTVAYTEKAAPVLLDGSVAIFDAELAAQGHYAGASVTLARSGGASAQDVFGASGSLSVLGSDVQLSGTVIGSFTHTAGALVITFNSQATQARVNEALSSLTYANTSNNPPASVTIDWTFNDGNAGVQGSGGAQSGSGTTVVNITLVNNAPSIYYTSVSKYFNENTFVAFNASDFSFTDVDTGDTLQSITIVKAPVAGQLFIDMNGDGRYGSGDTLLGNGAVVGAADIGRLTFRPADNAYGSSYANFTWTVSDGMASSTNVGTMTFNVNRVPVPPKVSGISASQADGSYKAGAVITIVVTFDQSVAVDGTGGTPSLLLDVAAGGRQAVYAGKSAPNSLNFTYVVQPGDTSADLDYLGTAALQTNNATIKNASGDAALLTLPAPGAAGSLGASKNIVIDTTAPGAPAITSAAAANQIAPTLTGTAEAGATVTLTVGGATYTTTATGGTWAIDLATATPTSGTLALNTNGDNPVSVTATDAAGNGSQAATQTLAIDTVPPAAPAITSASVSNQAQPTLAGTAEAGATIIVTIGGATYTTTASGGTWSIDLATATPISGTLALNTNGDNPVSVTATDAAGNGSQAATQTLAIDAVPPAAPVITSAATSNQAQPVLTGTAEAGATVQLQVGGALYTTTATGGTWSIDLATETPTSGTLALNTNGDNPVSVTATDAAGNGSQAAIQTLAIDTTAPSFDPATSTPADDATNVPVGAPLVLVFSERLGSVDSTKVYLHDAAGLAIVSIQASIDSNGRLVITPTAALKAGAAYHLTWGAGAILDMAGNAANALSDTAVFNFTTAGSTTPTDPTEPTLPTQPTQPTEPTLPTEPTEPTQTTETVDGIPVSTRPGDGGTTITSISVIPGIRTDDPNSPHPDLADIAIVRGADGHAILQVGLPIGVGLQAQGVLSGLAGTAALNELLLRIESAGGNTEQLGLARIFDNAINPGVPLNIQTLTLGTGAGFDPTQPIVVRGSTLAGDGQQGVILDARALPPGQRGPGGQRGIHCRHRQRAPDRR